MRFDLVDLQLFIAVADARSITRGAARVHLALASASARIKGLEAALGVALLKRGRRGVELTAAGESLLDHARHRACTMSRRCAAISPPMPAASRPASICSPILPACPNICRRRWRRSCANIPTSMSTSRSAKAPTSPPRSPAGAADLGFAAEHALPDKSRAVPVQRGPAGAGGGAAQTSSPAARQIDFHEVRGPRFRRSDQRDRAPGRISPDMPRGSACACDFGRGLQRFRCDLPDGGGRRRHRRGAGSRRAGAARDQCRSVMTGSAMPGPTASSRSAPAASRHCRGRPSNWWNICAEAARGRVTGSSSALRWRSPTVN